MNPSSKLHTSLFRNSFDSFPQLVTFDSRGISGHPNHCALYEAALLLNEDPRLCPALDIYVLETINKARAYSVFMDAFQVTDSSNAELVLSSFRRRACSLYRLKKRGLG